MASSALDLRDPALDHVRAGLRKARKVDLLRSQDGNAARREFIAARNILLGRQNSLFTRGRRDGLLKVTALIRRQPCKPGRVADQYRHAEEMPGQADMRMMPPYLEIEHVGERIFLCVHAAACDCGTSSRTSVTTGTQPNERKVS